MADRSEREAELERRGLFPWFPAHRITRIEREERAERLLGQIPLFSAVPPHRLRAMFQLARRERFRAGDLVIREGEIGSTLYVIRSGRMHVLRETDEGNAVILATLGPGEFFGELALFDRQPRSATVVAAEDTDTLSLGRVEILDIIRRYPEVALALLTSIGSRLRTADNLLENFSRVQADGPAPTSGS